MITKFSHVTLYVIDQEKAKDFYVNVLGFKLNTDVKMDNGFRWLSVNPPDQPDLQITLLSPLTGFMFKDDDVINAFRVLLEKGALGAGVMHTPDCIATYEELKSKGVHFSSAPKEQFYGIEAVITDECGNWFSMTQPKSKVE